MKKIILFLGLIFLSSQGKGQTINTIQNLGTELKINDSISIKKGDEILINHPAGEDFIFVKPNDEENKVKKVGKVADIVGTGASAIGLGTSNLKLLRGALKIGRGANTVKSGTEILDKVNNFNPKKIIGTTMKIEDWKFAEGGYYIIATQDKRTYLINLQEAVMAGEITLK